MNLQSFQCLLLFNLAHWRWIFVSLGVHRKALNSPQGLWVWVLCLFYFPGATVTNDPKSEGLKQQKINFSHRRGRKSEVKWIFIPFQNPEVHVSSGGYQNFLAFSTLRLPFLHFPVSFPVSSFSFSFRPFLHSHIIFTLHVSLVFSTFSYLLSCNALCPRFSLSLCHLYAISVFLKIPPLPLSQGCIWSH